MAAWAGRRIAVVTGTAMGALMDQVVEPLARRTGAEFEVIQVTNSLFGASVTTAGLLPGTAIQSALRGRRDFDLALLPGESVNDDGLFMDGMTMDLLAATVPMELRLSKDFNDALSLPVAA
jgi:NifB/MoaA-like Fe-S oxidoreductase